LPGGGFVVAWQEGQDNGRIRAALFDAAGQRRTSFPVGSVGGTGTLPSVAALDTGGFAIAWNVGATVHSQAFDTGGNPVGS
jgi:hypothetical protein